MASANSGTVQFQPVDTGDMSEIPPDLPAGAWEATCSVKKSKTSKDSFPMLILDWKTDTALTEGNEDHEGAKASDFLVFFPSSHKASRMFKVKLKGLCDALGIDIPATTAISSWDDLADFISELDGAKATIYTYLEERKDTGEMTTKVSYKAPGSSLNLKAAAADDEDEDEEKPAKKAPKLGPNGRPLKKKNKAN